MVNKADIRRHTSSELQLPRCTLTRPQKHSSAAFSTSCPLQLSCLALHDRAFARTAHGTPSRGFDSLFAFTLRAVLGIVGNLVCPAWAIVAIASRVPPGDLVLAPIFDDVACTHCSKGLFTPRRKPSTSSSDRCGSNAMKVAMRTSSTGTGSTLRMMVFFSRSKSSQKKPARFIGDISY